MFAFASVHPTSWCGEYEPGEEAEALPQRVTLSNAEREAIEVAAEAYSSDHGERFAEILRLLLTRSE